MQVGFSAAESVRRWVDEMPEEEVFRTQDSPASASTTSKVLSALIEGENTPIHRIRPGWYWKGFESVNGVWVSSAPTVAIASRHLGRGTGWAGWSALRALHWTNQLPCRQYFATVVPPGLPKPHKGGIFYQARSNRHRLDLSWWEVTVLEGLRSFGKGQRRWDYALAELTNEDWEFNHGPRRYRWLRPDALRWGAAGEPPNIREEMQERVEEIAIRLPTEVGGPRPDPVILPPTSFRGWLGPVAFELPLLREDYRRGEIWRETDWAGCR